MQISGFPRSREVQFDSMPVQLPALQFHSTAQMPWYLTGCRIFWQWFSRDRKNVPGAPDQRKRWFCLFCPTGQMNSHRSCADPESYGFRLPDTRKGSGQYRQSLLLFADLLRFPAPHNPPEHGRDLSPVKRYRQYPLL